MNLKQVTEVYESYEQKIGARKRVYETSGELCFSETIEKGVNRLEFTPLLGKVIIHMPSRRCHDPF